MALYCATVIGPSGAFINSHSHWVEAKAIAAAVDQANSRQGYGLGPHRVEVREWDDEKRRYPLYPRETLESYVPVHIEYNSVGYGLPRYDGDPR